MSPCDTRTTGKKNLSWSQYGTTFTANISQISASAISAQLNKNEKSAVQIHTGFLAQWSTIATILRSCTVHASVQGVVHVTQNKHLRLNRRSHLEMGGWI